MESRSHGSRKGSSVASLAPVNFIFHYEEFFLVGEGSCLTVYKDRTLETIVSKQIFEAQNVHGIREFVDGAGRFMLFGDRYQRRVELVRNEKREVDVGIIGPPDCLGDWIRDLKLFHKCEVVLTSHNRLMFIESEAKSYIHCAVSCILYSGCIVAEDRERILVASGTVFNEVLLWDGNSGEVYHRLPGHDGVIFSITISTKDNLLISTSDDRSARIYKLDPESDFSRPESVGQGSFTEIAACYGHSSRVWNACFWSSEVFATVGEDGNLCLWRIPDGSLLARRQMPFKSSIASICIHENVAYLGGAYGCFAAINVDELIDVGSRRSIVTLPRVDAAAAIKNVTIDQGRLVANDSRGNYMLNFVEAANPKWNDRFFLEEFQFYSVMGHVGGFLFTGCKLGIVVSFAITESGFVAWDTQQIHSGQIFSIVPFVNHKTNQMYVLTSGMWGTMRCWLFCQQQKTLVKLKTLALPIAQQRWATCAVHFRFNLIVVGDRQGNVILYSICPLSESPQPRLILLHLHGCNGTTDLQLFQDKILSCGRNGCIYQLDVQNDSLVVLRKIWLQSPMSWVAKLLVYNDRLVVAGFIADDFVVCDLESDYVLWSVTAKRSAHRPWDCSICSDRLYFATANRIDGGVSYEYVDIRKKMAKIARFPLHRKKINCVRTLWSTPERTVIVTGGEDNLVIISEVKGNQIRSLVRLCEHISSVKATDSAEICNDDRLLVTCGGRAQLNVWWVTADLSVKLMDQHFVWNSDHNSKAKPWKFKAGTKLDPLTRYLAVGLRCLEKSEPPQFQITTACSDGEIRLFDYVLDGKLQISRQFNSNNFCQQQSVWLLPLPKQCHPRSARAADSEGIYVNAATNGVLTCYGTSDVQAPLAGPTQVHQSGINAIALLNGYFATGGDDNALAVTEIRSKSNPFDAVADIAGTEDQRNRFQFEVKAKIEKAHSAQITSVHWWTEEIIMTVAIDQRMSWWRLKSDFTLERFGESTMTWISDVSGATILGNNDVLIIGQGAHIIRPDEALVKARAEFLEQTLEGICEPVVTTSTTTTTTTAMETADN